MRIISDLPLRLLVLSVYVLIWNPDDSSVGRDASEVRQRDVSVRSAHNGRPGNAGE